MFATRKQATEEASLWLERLERTLRADQAAQFREWLTTPLHREVIIERCSLWHGPDIMAVLEALIPDDVATSRRMPKRKRAWRALAWMLASCLVALSVLVLLDGESWLSGEVRQKTQRIEGHYRTLPGVRQQQIQLPDGTTMTMNVASSVFVNYGAKSRMVALSRGEITFDVSPDPARPFQLTVSGRVIEVERARLNVRRLAPGRSEITIIAGTARMRHPRVSERKTPAQLRDALHYSYGDVTLDAEDGGVFGPAWQSISRLSKDEIDVRLAWQRKQ
jgi:transmembrane sensor